MALANQILADGHGGSGLFIVQRADRNAHPTGRTLCDLASYVLLRSTRRGWPEQLFFFLGAVTAVTAYAMSYWAVGGWIERSAVFVFDSWFLFSMTRAYWFGLRGEHWRKREWLTRAIGILLGIATTRPVMGVFVATSSRTHPRPQKFFGIAFWIGFSINAAVIELWLHSDRRRAIHQRWVFDGAFFSQMNTVRSLGPD